MAECSGHDDKQYATECSGHDDEQYARSIELPPEEVFRNLRNAKHFAIDIGGSLVKIAYLSEIGYKRPRHYSQCGEEDNKNNAQPLYRVEEQVENTERLHFIKFETKYIEDSLDFIQKNLLSSGNNLSTKVIKATGGGAHKYKDLISRKLFVRVDKQDEMQCLINGCNFLLRHVPNECFHFESKNEQPNFIFKNMIGENLFPYLLVNIGSGVSIVKVEGPSQYERIGGTSTGGGTFWGLGSLLTNAKGFDELLEMASEGKTKNIDMLVRDIYGQAYSEMGLPEDLTASSFGKAAKSSRDNGTSDKDRFRPQDIAKALLRMISNDIGQIATLYALLHGLNRILFGGYFIRGHAVTMHTISYAVNFFSKGSLQALFLRHEGYLGAIGAFLSSTEDAALGNDMASWRENYAGSSGYPTDYLVNKKSSLQFDTFELDRIKICYDICPLLDDPACYQPDLLDLGTDEEARTYWLEIFETGLNAFANQAISSQGGQVNVNERAEQFKKQFVKRLNLLKEEPCSFGLLTVRSLLDTREQFLALYSFCDPYLQVKQRENEAAINLLKNRLEYLDKLEGDIRELEIIEGLVAGNMFDWGAHQSVKYLQDASFGFMQAKEKIKKRPWFCDDVDKWIEKRKTKKKYSLAVIFVDNSGADIILGVFPFARELIRNGTKVILAANSYPAINDVIFSELIIVADRVAEMCPIIRNALSDDTLSVMENGSSSACLDLRRIDGKLAEAMKNADLIMLQGMGRCIHTNYHAKFTCDSIRCAVLKNQWLAKKLGSELFDVVFKYETVK